MCSTVASAQPAFLQPKSIFAKIETRSTQAFRSHRVKMRRHFSSVLLLLACDICAAVHFYTRWVQIVRAGVDWLEKAGHKAGGGCWHPLRRPNWRERALVKAISWGATTTVKRDAQPRKWKQTAVYWISKHVNHAERVLWPVRSCTLIIFGAQTVAFAFSASKRALA